MGSGIGSRLVYLINAWLLKYQKQITEANHKQLQARKPDFWFFAEINTRFFAEPRKKQQFIFALNVMEIFCLLNLSPFCPPLPSSRL